MLPGWRFESGQVLQVVDKGLHVLLRQCRSQLLQSRCKGDNLFGRHKPKLTRWQGQIVVSLQAEQQRGKACVLKRCRKHLAVRFRARTGGNDPGKAHAFGSTGSGEAIDQRSNGSGKPPGPDHKHDRKPEYPGHIQGAACQRGRIPAVHKTHDPLDQDNVCAFGLVAKDLAYAFLAHEPGVQIEAGMLAGLAHEGRIHVVRSAFAAVHSVAQTLERNGKRQGDCCLSAS